FANLDRLAVTTGPGTFTGQRVGLAFMRGLRIALKKPLVGITTLSAMAHQAMAETGLDRAAAIHDAKRDEFYVEIAPGGESVILHRDTMLKRIGDTPKPLAIAGTGAPFVSGALKDKVVLSCVRQPDALWVAKLAAKAPEPSEAPRPLYLRAPDAKLPA
ncbi:MAG TPA: tRNA (adenosine(37)-N6)-threonylcarbamoyltransferase complex dimerization subunit type 1 TsaB, partial [Rhizomicrobium sp.]|nr:tRNA (adenosine(37)-N6)-threonylcarbamoyltransferase complex dimerization subunit type 1 TsaB [Rhizomicrobium sp.]